MNMIVLIPVLGVFLAVGAESSNQNNYLESLREEVQFDGNSVELCEKHLNYLVNSTLKQEIWAMTSEFVKI